MAGVKRSRAALVGEQRAIAAAAMLGGAVRTSRIRRRMTQSSLAKTVGISRQRLGDLETGKGASAPPEVWFALGEALGRYLKFEFGRDPQADLADAGHLDIQELVLRSSHPVGWEERSFEARGLAPSSERSIDVRLIDRKRRRLVINECWNTFGDLGAAARSSDRKLRDAQHQAVAIAGDGPPFEVGLCWIVRDTKANRALVNRYEHIFESRFPGSSQGWVRAITQGGPIPNQPGLIWCDLRATRLFARRGARVK